VKKAQEALLEWYEENGRHHLLWRNTEDIYHIYLSEVMLQQTQVSRVEQEYYPRFLEKFPTLEHLAAANEDEVLSSWSGLGYYSRARNLHKTAKSVGKSLPESEKELLKLPGIGRYTASAICSFGLKQSVPVVDTNIARVIKRFFALAGCDEKSVWEKAAQLLNKDLPREHNLALMDLGSMVCVPNNPNCSVCPLSSECCGKDEPLLYTKKKKTEYVNMELFYGLCLVDNMVGLQLSKGPMYKNMLELPDVDPIEENYLGSFKHSYTKYRLDVHLYKIQNTEKQLLWFNKEELDDAPISSLTRKGLSFLEKAYGF
jgi:A/G-specific adenine glycosylase